MGDSDNENANEFFDPEEEISVSGDKKLHLQDVSIETGEEKEDCIFKMRAKYIDGEMVNGKKGELVSQNF